MLKALEYAGFVLAFFSCLGYGRSVKLGAGIGILSSAILMVWGYYTSIYAALFTNVGFFSINTYNYWRAYASRTKRPVD